MKIPTVFRCDDGTEVPIVTVLDPMPADGTAVVIGDETGTGSLWVEWIHHGDVDLA